jgi:hypothetical protein
VGEHRSELPRLPEVCPGKCGHPLEGDVAEPGAFVEGRVLETRVAAEYRTVEPDVDAEGGTTEPGRTFEGHISEVGISLECCLAEQGEALKAGPAEAGVSVERDVTETGKAPEYRPLEPGITPEPGLVERCVTMKDSPIELGVPLKTRGGEIYRIFEDHLIEEGVREQRVAIPDAISYAKNLSEETGVDLDSARIEAAGLAKLLQCVIQLPVSGMSQAPARREPDPCTTWMATSQPLHRNHRAPFNVAPGYALICGSSRRRKSQATSGKRTFQQSIGATTRMTAPDRRTHLTEMPLRLQ